MAAATLKTSVIIPIKKRLLGISFKALSLNGAIMPINQFSVGLETGRNTHSLAAPFKLNLPTPRSPVITRLTTAAKSLYESSVFASSIKLTLWRTHSSR
jgi:hypothetical protein